MANEGSQAVGAIECLTSSTVTKVDVTLLDKESGDVALLYSIGLDLQKENNSLKDYSKRLEEAGDAMEKYIHDQTNTRFIICAIRWRETKEVK